MIGRRGASRTLQTCQGRKKSKLAVLCALCMSWFGSHPEGTAACQCLCPLCPASRIFWMARGGTARQRRQLKRNRPLRRRAGLAASSRAGTGSRGPCLPPQSCAGAGKCQAHGAIPVWGRHQHNSRRSFPDLSRSVATVGRQVFNSLHVTPRHHTQPGRVLQKQSTASMAGQAAHNTARQWRKKATDPFPPGRVRRGLRGLRVAHCKAFWALPVLHHSQHPPPLRLSDSRVLLRSFLDATRSLHSFDFGSTTLSKQASHIGHSLIDLEPNPSHRLAL